MSIVVALLLACLLCAPAVSGQAYVLSLSAWPSEGCVVTGVSTGTAIGLSNSGACSSLTLGGLTIGGTVAFSGNTVVFQPCTCANAQSCNTLLGPPAQIPRGVCLNNSNINLPQTGSFVLDFSVATPIGARAYSDSACTTTSTAASSTRTLYAFANGNPACYAPLALGPATLGGTLQLAGSGLNYTACTCESGVQCNSTGIQATRTLPNNTCVAGAAFGTSGSYIFRVGVPIAAAMVSVQAALVAVVAVAAALL